MDELPDGVRQDEGDGLAREDDDSPWTERYAITSRNGVLQLFEDEETGDRLLVDGEGNAMVTPVTFRIDLEKTCSCSACGVVTTYRYEERLPDHWERRAAGRVDGIPVTEVLCHDCS